MNWRKGKRKIVEDAFLKLPTSDSIEQLSWTDSTKMLMEKIFD